MHKNVKTDILTLVFLCTSIFTICSLYYAFIDIEGEIDEKKNHVNYVMWIYQYVLENVSIYVPADK